MRLEQLYHIVAIAQTKSISQAAERSYISQPALSSSVTKLEVDLGIPLFKRTSQGVFPTETGEAIISKAMDIIDLLEDIKCIAQKSTQSLTGSIHLAVEPCISNTIMVNILTSFKYKHPLVNVLMKVGESNHIHRDVLGGKADFGILMRTEELPEEKNLYVRELFKDKLVLLVGRDSPVSSRSEVTIKEALAMPLVMYSTDYDMDCVVSRLLGKLGELDIAYRLDSFQMLEQVISMNSCASFAPKFMSDYFLEKETIVPVDISDADLDVSIVVAWTKRHHLSLIEKELIATIKSLCSMCEFIV